MHVKIRVKLFYIMSKFCVLNRYETLNWYEKCAYGITFEE